MNGIADLADDANEYFLLVQIILRVKFEQDTYPS